MKILVAFNAADPKELAKFTLRWAGRAGYETKFFAPNEDEAKKLVKAIRRAAHDWYIQLTDDQVIVGDPAEYAKSHGIDLLVRPPRGLRKWNAELIAEENVYDYVTAIGTARLHMRNNPDQASYDFPNGTVMERVSAL